MELEYIIAEFKDKDEDGIYFGFEGKEPIAIFRISKYSGFPYELSGWKYDEEGAFYLRFLQVNRNLYK